MLEIHKKDYYYFCLSKYLFNVFSKNFKNVEYSNLSINNDIYYNKNKNRENSIIISYYPYKNRMIELVEEII